MDLSQPKIIEETDNYAVVFKPAKMHCIPRSANFDHEGANGAEEETKTLCGFVRLCGKDSSVLSFEAMHRLDYETHGLVLFAKNEKSYHFFKDLQDRGEFVKEYSAVCMKSTSPLPLGFPPCSLQLCRTFGSMSARGFSENIIESYFRPFGPGRKLVRPVIDDGKKHKEIAKDNGGFYRTEIIGVNDNVFTVRLKRGFRHQIRCHLCWIGFPILNDPLYLHETENNTAELTDKMLALRAHALFFADPASGERKECRIAPINT